MLAAFSPLHMNVYVLFVVCWSNGQLWSLWSTSRSVEPVCFLSFIFSLQYNRDATEKLHTSTEIRTSFCSSFPLNEAKKSAREFLSFESLLWTLLIRAGHLPVVLQSRPDGRTTLDDAFSLGLSHRSCLSFSYLGRCWAFQVCRIGD